MLPYIYWILLLASCGYALICGRRDERVVAIVCLMATVASLWALPPVTERYAEVESGVMFVDLFTFIAFLSIALMSDRFWPLWVAGLHLTGGLAHIMKVADLDLMPQAYAAAARFWSYPILIILVVGTWRSHQRMSREPDRSSIPA